MTPIDDSYDDFDLESTLILTAELGEAICGITHISSTPEGVVDYIRQKFEEFDVAIPVCQTCVDRLHSDDWILLYCVNCCCSLWIYKPDSSRGHLYTDGEHIKWMDSCPHCHGGF